MKKGSSKQKYRKFKKVVVLDTVIFYPNHRKLLNSIAEEVVEYPTSLPEELEKQHEDNPEIFKNKKCYTHIASDDMPKQLLMNRVEGADVIISCWTNIPDEIIEGNPQLKLIAFWTHEREHRINVGLAAKKGIAVINIPDYGTDAVSEVVFAGMWHLIQRNFSMREYPHTTNQVANAVVERTFQHFRKLLENEKYTRAGKFGHHFHKLGMIKFDFGKKDLNELIPERLVKYKRVGFMNTRNTEEAIKKLSTFNVICEEYNVTDTSLASYYKFLAENEIVFYDEEYKNSSEIQKAEKMFGDKFVSIGTLIGAEYPLEGKVFGVVGLGRIGVQVARIAKTLGFEVWYFSQTRKQSLERELGLKYASLTEIASKSDVLSIHLPAHKAEGVFDAALISKLKKGAIFINTADGNAIDQAALTKRMQNDEVFAYLDVYPGLPRKDILGMEMENKSDWKIRKALPNHIIAYRAGWRTQESLNVKTYKLLGEMMNNAFEPKMCE